MATSSIHSMPMEYSFVVFSLDSVATVSNLKNEELTAACRRLPRKRYVAFVGDRHQFFMPWEPYHSWPFYLVFQGLREENQGKGIEPQMSVPILPNKTHPLCREPLDPGYPLPWNNCYISDFIQFDARVATRVTEEEPVCWATPDEVARIQGYFEEDIQRRRQLKPQIVAIRAIIGDTRSLESNGTESEAPWGSRDDLRSVDEESEDQEESSESRTAGEDDTGIMLGEMTSRPHNGLVVIEVSFDLSSADQIHRPEEFFEEVKFLKRLTKELEDAKKLREIENTQRMKGLSVTLQIPQRKRQRPTDYAQRLYRRIIRRIRKLLKIDRGIEVSRNHEDRS